MGLVRDWTRQAARAAGASLIAPVVLLLAAALVGVTGGGLGGLGQIAAGPSLPDTDLAAAPKTSLADAEIAAVDVGAERAPAPAPSPLPLPERTPVRSTGALASAAPPVPRPAPVRIPARVPPRRLAVTPRPPRPVTPQPPSPPLPPVSGNLGPSVTTPATPERRPNPAAEAFRNTQDLLGTLERNLGDTTTRLLRIISIPK